jgi:alpha,alpha-trehalose phosphorylase
MITQRTFPVEPWTIRETELDLDVLAQTESLFALSNGHIGWRGNLDEGEPHGLPGSYLGGFHELRPLPYAEAGYGYPESGQSIINVTNGKLIRLLIDDEPFDVRYGDLRSHERELDLRDGVLRRDAEWVSPAGSAVRVRSTRLVSFTQRAVAAISYEVEAVDGAIGVVVQSGLVANEQLPETEGDPRAAAALDKPLCSELHMAHGTGAVLVHHTARSGLRMAAAMDHVVEGPDDILTDMVSYADDARFSVTTRLLPGQKLRLIKFVGYGWSANRSRPALRDQAAAAITAAKHSGWDGLLREQREYLDDFWAHADVEVDGDAEIQQAVRFALFHVLGAGARAEARAIPAKGLTGPGYDGHAFWDTEAYVLPVLTYTRPSAVADALRWRQSTLPLAVERAAQLGLAGAAFPWRTIAGEECSAYWPAGTAAFHVTADIAGAVTRYDHVTGDTDFACDTGLELLVNTARLWRALGHHDGQGRFRISGVTGPDEYSSIADDNVYTNLMAKLNLRAAADAVERFPSGARSLGADNEEAAGWRDAADAMYLPFDAELGVHPQAEGFTGHQRWDFEKTPAEKYPLLLNYPYFDLYRKQVVKQADLVLAMCLHPHEFTAEQKAANFAYYEALTVRDSSLSACFQAVMAAETGHLDLAWDYTAEAALMDLEDLQHNTRDGLHIASLAGSWLALVMGFGGLRQHGSLTTFAPRLPEQLARLTFRLTLRGLRLYVEIAPDSVTYLLSDGDGTGGEHPEDTKLRIEHHGVPLTLTLDKPLTVGIPPLPHPGPRPTQPHGREPVRRPRGEH